MWRAASPLPWFHSSLVSSRPCSRQQIQGVRGRRYPCTPKRARSKATPQDDASAQGLISMMGTTLHIDRITMGFFFRYSSTRFMASSVGACLRRGRASRSRSRKGSSCRSVAPHPTTITDARSPF
ncbi:hypothetical protein BV25DRAFT_640465 [Artomyces pyxidatus]|uniref:Uncharacterized protein n=1 Tax=Artomyces pyxidatus TaxID=48021 RepID=A0ACB8T1E6_9AGAM|nr:hypothetical protein BV25DRAFT_640465 [Artomyces pyxidatus]